MEYYSELAELWLSMYSALDLAHIILSCCVHYKVDGTDSCMLGTGIVWSTLIQDALVFLYLDSCYVIPMSLIWNVKVGSPTMSLMARKKSKVKGKCESKVANLKIEDLFISYEHLCSLDLYHLGMAYESLFVASLAVKYYLHSVEFASPAVALSDIYDLDTEEACQDVGLPPSQAHHLSKPMWPLKYKVSLAESQQLQHRVTCPELCLQSPVPSLPLLTPHRILLPSPD
ncbi:hypothetical protein HDU77_011298 [Chytriomyces hyalinus]|nr:hypothetical protein HDU77_011298 [Chytriomyces hyalinus]